MLKVILTVLGLHGFSSIYKHLPRLVFARLIGAFDRVAETEQHKLIAAWLCNWFAEGNPGAPWLVRVLQGLYPNVRRKFIAKTIANIFFRDPEVALNSPFFKGLRGMQPFYYNTLRPCPIIDQPKILRLAVKRWGAYPTHEGTESLLEGEIAAGLDRYTAGVKEVMMPVWEQEYAYWAER